MPPTFARINLPQVVHEAFDDEIVIVNLDTGNYYSLEGIGAEIWRDIERGADYQAIAESLAQRYDGGLPEIDAAVDQLFAELHGEQIVTLVDAPPEARNGVSTAFGGAYSSEDKKRFSVPVLNRFTDMQELLLLDPVHDVDETGWPRPKEAIASPK